MVLGSQEYPVIKKLLHVPELQELSDVLNHGLRSHFAEVHVEVVDCPDLTHEPFSLANKGLNGNPSLLDVGGPRYLLPTVDRSKVYDLMDIANISEIKPTFLIGAGAGPFNHYKTNCEGIFNVNFDGDEIKQESRIGLISLESGGPMELKLGSGVTEFGLLGNFFASQGLPGKVLKVHVVKRIGGDDFIASMRRVLGDFYRKKGIVGLGGAFVMKKGSAKLHIMPDFSKTPIEDDARLNDWLQFFNMTSPLIGLGTLVTGTYGMDLREQHFHMFSGHGDAGHYHIDTTPEIVEYLGYFNVANRIYRVDQPKDDAAFGKD